MINLVLGLLLSTTVHALPEPADVEYIERAKPLIMNYLNTQAREYGVDLTVDPYSWSVPHTLPERYFNGLLVATSYAKTWTSEVVDFSCHEVTVDLPARAARAHFYVGQTVARRNPRADQSELLLVGSCSPLVTFKPAMTMEPLSPRARTFDSRELVMRSTPLIANLLKLNGESSTLTRGSVKLRKNWRWLYEWAFARDRDCRTLKFRVGSRIGFVQLAVSYDEPNISPDLPVEVQSLLKDPVSLRTFRFALVNGCSDAQSNRVPELKLVRAEDQKEL